MSRSTLRDFGARKGTQALTRSLLALGFLLLAGAWLHGQVVLYEEDFSGNSAPGSYKHVSNDNTFYNEWSVTGSLVQESGDQRARIELSAAWTSSNPNARWDGGLYYFFPELTNLPPRWSFSWQVLLPEPEPLQVELKIIAAIRRPGGPPTSGVKHRELKTWVYPSGSGWQTMVVGSHTDWEEGESSFGPPRLGTEFRLGMVSHDADGDPLSLARPGTYELLVDDLRLVSYDGPPRLRIAQPASDSVRVLWPAVYADFEVESTSTPASGGWLPVNLPRHEEAGWQWIEVVPEGHRFYRLRK